MCVLLISRTAFAVTVWLAWDPVNRFNHTSWMAVVTPTDHPKSVHNRCVIEVFCGVFVFPRYYLEFSVGVGDFVIGLSQISSVFSKSRNKEKFIGMHRVSKLRYVPFVTRLHILTA